MLHTFIYGIETVLGSSCAARLLQVPNGRISYFPNACSKEQITDLILSAGLRTGDQATITSRSEIQHRCCPADLALDLSRLESGLADVDEAWFFRAAGSIYEETAIDRLIEVSSAIGAGEFNYVLFDTNHRDLRPGVLEPLAGATAQERSGDAIARQCESRGVKFRLFLTSLIAGTMGLAQEQNSGVLSRFLARLHSFKAELEERAPQYFDFHALRYLAPADATINILPDTVASDLLQRIARKPSTANARFSIVSPHHTLFTAWCEQISMAYGFGLLPVEDPAELNAVDRAFQERSGELQEHLETRAEAPDIASYRAAGLSPGDGAIDDQAQVAQLEAIYRNLEAIRAERDRRTTDALEKRTVSRDGSVITYYSGGTSGPTVVLLNALGQGLEFWYRLIDQLIDQYHIVIWEPRGTVGAPARLGLADQVRDLDAILRHEAIHLCHLVGWCTGPKVITEFYFRRPEAVASMVFLNGTFKCDGSPEELDTPYEKNLEFLCRKLVQKPAMASSIMKAFQSRAAEDEAGSLDSGDSEEVGVKVLSSASLKPRMWVMAPFASEETTLNYAHQLVDFWSVDVRPRFSQINVPVLLLSTEYDGIVTAASSRMAAGLLPDARHIHVAAATHYCLYDRPDFVAQLLHRFFQDPGNASAATRVEHAVALGA